MTTTTMSPLLDLLFAQSDGVIELRTIPPGGTLNGRLFLAPDDQNGLTKFVGAHVNDNIFFGVASRRDGTSGALENCAQLSALFCDFDFKQVAEAVIRQRLYEFPLPPSIAVLSGGGLHVYWLLREPLNLQDPVERTLAKSLLRRLAHFLNADMVAAEPVHILRVPGTLNYKYDPPRHVRVDHLTDEIQYHASEFDELLPPESAEKMNGAPFTSPKRIRHGDRNTTLYKTGRSLRAKGLCRQAIREALHAENRVKCEPPLPDTEIDEEILVNIWTQPDRPAFWGPIANPIEAMRLLPPDELRQTWTKFLFGQDAATRHDILHEVTRLTGIKINTLKQQLRDDQAKAKQVETAARVGMRAVIPFHVEDVCQAADRVERAMVAQLTDGECVRFSDSLVRVVLDVLPFAHQADSDLPAMPTAQLDLLTRAKLLPLVERAVVLQADTDRGPVPIGVPEKMLDQILVNPRYISQVSALVTHPIVTMSGRILATDGIDPQTRLFLHGSAIDGLRPYTQAEAEQAVQEIQAHIGAGFEFATPLDMAGAVALMATAVERKLLDQSPGFLIRAAQQGIGKTTLGRRTHLVLTGTDAPVFTWPENDEEEVQKVLISTLLRNPAMMCFDNIGEELTFRSPALSSAMTSASKQGRLLGHNRDAIVSTAVLFVLTGNNIQLANDEVYRWVPITLTSTAVDPQTRRFAHPDIIRHALEIRELVLRHIIGIVAGYRQGPTKIEPLSRFPRWDALVRQPLMWAGLPDIGAIFQQNAEESAELGAHRALVRALYREYVLVAFSAHDLVGLITQEDLSDTAVTIKEAVLQLGAKDHKSPRSVGHALSKVQGRPIAVPRGMDTSVLVLKKHAVDGLTRYQVGVTEQGDSIL